MPAKDRSKRLKSYQDKFLRHWLAAFRNVSTKGIHLTAGQLRLVIRILNAALRSNRFAVTFSSELAMTAAYLSRSKLYEAHSALSDLHIITATNDGKGNWVYELLDPETRKPFAGAARLGEPVIIEDEWGSFELQ